MKIENPKDFYELFECRKILAHRFPNIGDTLHVEGEDGEENKYTVKVISADFNYTNDEEEAVVGMVVLEFPNKMIESFMLTIEDEWWGTDYNKQDWGMDVYLTNRHSERFAYEIVR